MTVPVILVEVRSTLPPVEALPPEPVAKRMFSPEIRFTLPVVLLMAAFTLMSPVAEFVVTLSTPEPPAVIPLLTLIEPVVAISVMLPLAVVVAPVAPPKR